MADAITNEFGYEVELIGGHGGVLDIKHGDKLLFSKHQAGYKPTPAEVVGLFKSS